MQERMQNLLSTLVLAHEGLFYDGRASSAKIH